MDFRDQLARRSRDARWVAAVLACGLILATFLYWLAQRGSALPSALVTNRVLLFSLTWLNFTLILVIFFVLTRNLIRLWLERRTRAFGARFKTKLVATYIGLSLAPVLALFFFANQLLQGSIDRWFSASLSDFLAQGEGIAQTLQRTIADRNWRDAARLAGELSSLDLGETAGRTAAGRRLARARDEIGVDFVALYDRDDFVQAVLDPSSGIADLPELGRSLPREAIDRGRADRVLEPPGTRGRLIVAAATAGGRVGGRAVVVVGTLLDPIAAGRSERLIRAYQSYRQLEVQKGEFKTSYLLIFILVTLLILLASSWTGLFLARRLMTPVQAVAEAMLQISSGDLDQRVDVPVDQEMSVVVDSFNRMAGELSRSRELIEASHRELTEANRGLDEERALVGAILENLAAGVVALDRQGRVLAVNGAAQQMLRLRGEDLDGRPFADALDGEARAALSCLVDPAARPERGASQLSFPVAGTWRTFEVRVSPLPAPDGGEPTGCVLVVEDLTELLRAQKLATWTEAARRVAHEIKNPLTPIRLAAERLRERSRRTAGGTTEMVEQAVEIIVREVGNMQQLVDEFSRFARLPGPRLAATDLAPLVAEVTALYRDLKPGVEVHGEVETALGEIWVDAEQLRRVFINLLDNAIEATGAPGRVAVAVRRDGGEIEIAVADTGPGVPPEEREKVFLPFFSRKGRGSGLGLAIVHRVIADHDGSIRIEENEPHGAVFRIRLPARGGAATAENAS